MKIFHPFEAGMCCLLLIFEINDCFILITSSLLSERNNKPKFYICHKIYLYFHFKIISVEKIIVYTDNLVFNVHWTGWFRESSAIFSVIDSRDKSYEKRTGNNFPGFENCDTHTKPYLISKTKPYFQIFEKTSKIWNLFI